MRQLTRRQLLVAASAGALAASAGGYLAATRLGRDAQRAAVLPRPRPGLPGRQHAWEATLTRDEDGNPVLPRFHRLLFFDLPGPPTPVDARRLEAALRTLERAYPFGADGLVTALGWGPTYFEDALGLPSPVDRPQALSTFEAPRLDRYAACLHLASDDEARLEAVERALVNGADLASARRPVDLRGLLSWRETRTGFVGEGLPAAHQAGTSGLPSEGAVPSSSPLFMGFKSSFRRNQASEDDVTIPEGRFAAGTTMQVSRLRLRLASWYELFDECERVARMFAPQLAPADVARFGDEATLHEKQLEESARRYGVIGHGQAVARARRQGRPRILRRDFNTVDGDEAGLHFVSLQRSIEDFVATRRAMNASQIPYLNPAITPVVNNGINEFFLVVSRATYLVPPRRDRAFPALPGREAALA